MMGRPRAVFKSFTRAVSRLSLKRRSMMRQWAACLPLLSDRRTTWDWVRVVCCPLGVSFRRSVLGPSGCTRLCTVSSGSSIPCRVLSCCRWSCGYTYTHKRWFVGANKKNLTHGLIPPRSERPAFSRLFGLLCLSGCCFSLRKQCDSTNASTRTPLLRHETKLHGTRHTANHRSRRSR